MNEARRTVLITGCSSGIGKAAAIEFQRKGWNVIATARNPEALSELRSLPNVKVLSLDVTNAESVRAAIREGVAFFGAVHALVNNAGYGLHLPFEMCSPEQVQDQFETNVFGLMRVTREAIPSLIASGGGTIVNVSSMLGRFAMPYYSVYCASKWAVEGFTEGLHMELQAHGIRLKLVEPGATRTRFFGTGNGAQAGDLGRYEQSFQKGELAFQKNVSKHLADPERVASRIFQATTDSTPRLRYLIGMDARILLFLRRLLPDWLFLRFLVKAFGV